jgi:hypothetical protein
MSKRSLNGIESDDVRSLNGLSVHSKMLKKLKATQPLEYDPDTFTYSLKGLSGFTANKIIKCNPAGDGLIYADDNNTEYTATLPLSISPSNVISTAFTADSTTTMSNKTISDELHGNNNVETYIDFNQQYGFPIYGYYVSASSRSYNMSFKNTQTSSNYPFIGVSNAGDMLLHINGVGDAMIVKADRDININVGDLIGDTTSYYSKNRMKDIYCRNIYTEPIVIKNGSTSSAYISLYENSDNGTNYIKLEAPASLGSDITATLPSSTGVLALQSEIRTDAQIRGLFSGTLPISVSASGVISTAFTISSSDNLSNKTFTDLTNFNASISVKNSSNFGTGSVRFYDLDNSHYTEVKSPDTMLQNAGITLPNVTCVLSYNGQNVSLFNNDAGYITATSTETLENKTLKSPIFTSQSGAYEKMILKDENLTHNINIFTPDLTDNINVAFPSATGTLAITDDIHTTAEIRGLFSGTSPVSFNSGTGAISLTGLSGFTANKFLKVNSAGNALEYADDNDTNYWELSSLKLTPTDDTYNVIIGQKANGNSNNVELLVYGDAEIKQKLRSSSDTEIYLNFDTTYGVKCFGKYYAPTTTSYNMSFENTQTSSTYPFIGVSNTGDFIIHINGVGDALKVEIDRDINVIAGDIVGNTASQYGKTRMKDIYCNGVYSEGLVAKIAGAGGHILLYENPTAGDHYTKIKAMDSIGANNTITLPEYTGNLIIDSQPLEISPTNSSSFYIAQFLAASISNSNTIEMVMGKANASKNCSTFQYFHAGDGLATNYLQIGIKTIAEDAIKVISDGNIELNTTQVKHDAGTATAFNYVSSDSGSANLIISGGVSGSTKQTGQIILRSVGSSTTSGTLDFNGSNDKMTLKCIDGELDLGGNSAIQMTCKTDEVNVASSFVSASNRFKVKYSSSYCYFSNPSGTNYDDDALAGSFMAYHDNASVLWFNTPYNAAVVGNHDHYYGGTIKQRFQASGICSTTGQFLDNVVFSDDRLKEDETDLSNCMSIINKLKPQIYQKYSLTGLSPEDPLKPNEYVPFTDRISDEFTIQSGFIAQEVYTIPELRHIVVLPEESDLELIKNTEISDNPSIDPSYNGWGTKTPASVLSTQIIPYLVGALQEQQKQIDFLLSKINV